VGPVGAGGATFNEKSVTIHQLKVISYYVLLVEELRCLHSGKG